MTKEVYILLTYTGTLFSKGIKLYTKNKYTHVSLSLDHNLESVYSFGRKYPFNPLIGGFVKEDMKKGTYSWYPFTDCVVYRLKVTNEQYENIKEIIKQFESSSEKYKYNLLGFVGVVFNVPIETKYHYFCSQFVAKVMEDSNINLFNKHNSLVRPSDFQKSPYLEKIYEGMLYKYPPNLNKLEEYFNNTGFSMRKYFLHIIRKYLLHKSTNSDTISLVDGYIKPKKISMDKKIRHFYNTISRLKMYFS